LVPLASNGNKLFQKYCSKSCSSKAAYLSSRTAIRNNHNVDNPMHIPGVIDKVMDTVRRSNDGLHWFQTEEFKRRIKESNLNKFGIEYHTQLEDVMQKARKTLMASYGVENPSQSELIKAKKKTTLQSNYGVDNLSQSDIIKERRKRTMISLYGTEYYSQSEHYKKRNVEHGTYLGWKEREHEILSLIDDGITGEQSGEHLGFKSKSNVYNVVLPYFGIDPALLSRNYTGKSNLENKIFEYVKEGCANCKQSFVVNNKEIDIFLPDKNIGIEINGNYWHSHIFKNKNDHLNKTEIMEDEGIHLIQIYEYELMSKPDKVFSLIDNIIQESQTIGARKTCFDFVDSKMASRFHQQYHFDGKRGASVHCGLFLENELVMCASLSPHNEGMELIRLSSSCRIVGGLSNCCIICYSVQNL